MTIRSKGKERRPHLEPLEAKVENNDSQGGKKTNGASIVGVHSPLHTTHLHLLFLNEHLETSTVRETGYYGVQDLPLDRCIWFYGREVSTEASSDALSWGELVNVGQPCCDGLLRDTA